MFEARFYLFTFYFFLLLNSFFVYGTINCGNIYDGLTNGKFDIQIQASKTSFGANWFDFGSNILSYEWAIFSDNAIPLNNGESSSCVSQLRYIPDIQPWTNILKNTNGFNNDVILYPNHWYFSAVRVTYRSGEQIIKISNGVQVVNEDDFPHIFNKNNNIQENDEIIENEVERNIQQSFECSIDENNRCRSGTISVSDKLNELYGRAIFPATTAEAFLFPATIDDDDDDNDDDDGNNEIWVLAPILGLALLTCCLLLLFLLLVALCGKGFEMPERSSGGGGGGGAKPAPVEFENVNESKGYGQREQVETVDASTNTVVEFPDTQIRRLSISHQDAPEIVEDDKPKGRIPHPIMSSASSSFRDYRNSGT